MKEGSYSSQKRMTGRRRNKQHRKFSKSNRKHFPEDSKREKNPKHITTE